MGCGAGGLGPPRGGSGGTLGAVPRFQARPGGSTAQASNAPKAVQGVQCGKKCRGAVTWSGTLMGRVTLMPFIGLIQAKALAGGDAVKDVDGQGATLISELNESQQEIFGHRTLR